MPPQRRRRHFKSGQATTNKRSLMHVEGVGGLQQAMYSSKRLKPTCRIKMHKCRCSLVGPCRAPDTPAKEQERLLETRTRREKASLLGTPGPIVSSSDCLCTLRTRLKPDHAAGPVTPPLLPQQYIAHLQIASDGTFIFIKKPG